MTSSFSSSVISSLKLAASLTKSTAESAIAHLRAPPTEIACPVCAHNMPVPPRLFDWKCIGCHSTNQHSSPACYTCGVVRASGSAPALDPVVICPQCSTRVSVPLSNAMKHATTVTKVTKDLVSKGAGVAKAQYEALAASPMIFHCEHCNMALQNPNCSDAPPVYTAEETKSAPRLYRVTCPRCFKETEIPSTVAQDNIRRGSFLVAAGASKIYYTTTQVPHSDCPKCKTSIELPSKKQPEYIKGVVDLGGGLYSVTCPTCREEFAAGVPS